jgi:WhiB family redox-sensing transcriptional regulator
MDEPVIEINPARWWEHGECRGMDPNLWFPERGEDSRPAKAVCAVCPVRTHCLEDALEHDDHFGIWGGTSERERRRIRYNRRRSLAITGRAPITGRDSPA